MDFFLKVLSEQGLTAMLLVFFIIQNAKEKKDSSGRLAALEDYQKNELKKMAEDSLEMNGKCLSVMKESNRQMQDNTHMLRKLEDKL